MSQGGVGHATPEQRQVRLIKWRLGGAAGPGPAARPPSRGPRRQGTPASPRPLPERLPARPPQGGGGSFRPHFYYRSNKCSTQRKQSAFTAPSKKNPGRKLVLSDTFITARSKPCAPCCLSQVLSVEAAGRSVSESVQRGCSECKVLTPRDSYT